jgi:hypothetical protein
MSKKQKIVVERVEYPSLEMVSAVQYCTDAASALMDGIWWKSPHHLLRAELKLKSAIRDVRIARREMEKKSK